MKKYTIPKYIICDALENTKRNILHHTEFPRFFAILVKEIPEAGDFVNFKDDEYLLILKWIDEVPKDKVSPLLDLKLKLKAFLKNNPRRSLMPEEQAITLEKFRTRVDRLIDKGYLLKDIAKNTGISRGYMSMLYNGKKELHEKYLLAFKAFEDKTKR